MANTFRDQSDQTPDPPTTSKRRFTEAFVLDAFVALRQMALLSNRRQAELGIALGRARLDVAPENYEELVKELQELNKINEIVRLVDGGILVTVQA